MDVAVQTALLDAAVKKHPHMPLKKVIEKYWYEDAFGRHFYSLEDDRSVRVVKLADTLLVVHPKMILDANPYIHTDYMEDRLHTREMQNVTGRYLAVWERQEGKCYYCGRPILSSVAAAAGGCSPKRIREGEFSDGIRDLVRQHQVWSERTASAGLSDLRTRTGPP